MQKQNADTVSSVVKKREENGGESRNNGRNLSGTSGGTAIKGSSSISTLVENYGIIGGGGGGSGGAWLLYFVGLSSFFSSLNQRATAGGCGGAPLGKGRVAPTVDFGIGSVKRFDGKDATLTTAYINEANIVGNNATLTGGFYGGSGTTLGNADGYSENGRAGYLSEGPVTITNFSGGKTYGIKV